MGSFIKMSPEIHADYACASLVLLKEDENRSLGYSELKGKKKKHASYSDAHSLQLQSQHSFKAFVGHFLLILKQST